MPAKSKPSPYPLLPFHAIRAISFTCSLIVTGIVGWFCYQLKHDGYKLPWTFLIILIASIVTLLTLTLTSIIHCCAFLSPLLNLILNTPLLLAWITGFILLTWNTYGTLTHSCSLANWGNSDGMMICRCYKANYTFVIIALVSHLAMIILDIRARRHQTALGRYEQMNKSNAEKHESDGPWSFTTPDHNRTQNYRDASDVVGNVGPDGGKAVPYGLDPDSVRPRPASGPINRYQSPNPTVWEGRQDYNLRDFRYHQPEQQTIYDSHISGMGYSGHQR